MENLTKVIEQTIITTEHSGENASQSQRTQYKIGNLCYDDEHLRRLYDNIGSVLGHSHPKLADPTEIRAKYFGGKPAA